MVIFLYLVLFSLWSSRLWELRDNGFVKIWNFDPKASESSQNFKISNVGYSVDLPQVDCVSAEGARDAGEASKSERRITLLQL